VPRAIIEAPNMTTHERVYKFGTPALIQVYENSFIEDFRQECELSWADDESAFFPMELIFRCVDPELTMYSSFEEFRENLKGIPRGGFDVGRRKNPSVLILTEEIHNKNFVRMIIPMHKMEFEEQKFKLSEAMRILPIPRLCIDETGIGMNLAEDLAKKYPHIVVPVNFAGSVEAAATENIIKSKNAKVAVKERMATSVRIAFERGDIVIPQDKDLIQEIHSIKRDVSISGRVTYDVEKNERHHGDMFWALALALFEGSASKRSGVWW
jgi:phage FluMu gp28-like protein